MKTAILKGYKNTKQAEITLDDGTVIIIRERWDRKDARDYNKKPRLYVGVGEWNLAEDLRNRQNRPYAIWRKMIRDIAARNDLPFSIGKLPWSQNAGCGFCPCSPGFILDQQSIVIGDEYIRHFDVDVNFAAGQAPRVNDAA